MSLQPNGGKLLMPVETEIDVSALFEKAQVLSQTAGFLTRDRSRVDSEDHFSSVGAVCPQYFRPLQQETVNLPGKQLTFFPFALITPFSKAMLAGRHGFNIATSAMFLAGKMSNAIKKPSPSCFAISKQSHLGHTTCHEGRCGKT